MNEVDKRPIAPRDLGLGTYPHAVARAGRVFIGNVLPVHPDGSPVVCTDIQDQTHAVFRQLQTTLGAMGAELADLVRINTYYVFEGPEEEATRYWERMTQVRLQYFADPGPVGTAVRVVGTGMAGALIQLEAEALLPADRVDRVRIMPSDSWDWSVPVPLSQGWRHRDFVWVGGQVCADRQGRAEHVGDLDAQTEAVLRYVGNVLRDAGALPEHLLHLKICYLHDGDDAAAQARLAAIVSAAKRVFGGSVPPITAFGVDLLYEGLMLEIDASAVVSSECPMVGDAGAKPGAGQLQVTRLGRFIQTAGIGLQAADGASVLELLDTCLSRCRRAVEAAGGTSRDIARLTAFVSASTARQKSLENSALLLTHLRSSWGAEAFPATTISIVEGLPGGAAVQVDALACLED